MALPTAAYLVIVLGILLFSWALATLIYFLLRRRNLIPSLFASSPPHFVRPVVRPARFGIGASGGLGLNPRGGRGGIVGGAAPWQVLTQEWKPVFGEKPRLEERVMVVLQGGGGEGGEEEEEEWKPLNAQIQSSPSHPSSLILSFLIALPAPPPSPSAPDSDSSLTDLEFATVSLPLPPTTFAQLLPLASPLESLGPLEKIVNGVRMRREWVRAAERGRQTAGVVWM